MDPDVSMAAGLLEAAAKRASAPASAATGSGSSSKTAAVPAPPEMPKYLAPTPRDFAGYKLEANPLPCKVIPLREPLCTGAGVSPTAASAAEDSNAPPSSFHALSQKLKTNQLVVLRSEDPTQPGAHAVYYIDHKAVWQLDPPGAAATAAAPAAQQGDAAEQAASRGGSHMVYEFDSVETGDGMSFVGVAPCLLLLTRAGGRLTVFLVNPEAGSHLGSDGADVPPLVVLFDGSPLSPAPLNPHHATISAALLSAKRDQLFVVLYEFWQEHVDTALKEKETRGISFVHEEDALRTAGAVAPTAATEGYTAISSHGHALHKLTAVQFTIENVAALHVPSATAPLARNAHAEAGAPRMDLVHSFSSVQNYELPKEDVPASVKTDSEWSAPLACWLQLPPVSTHQPTPSADSSVGASSTSSPTPPNAPFLWFVASRVPFLNETESVVHEIERRRVDKEMEDKQARMRDRADQIGAEAVRTPGIGAGAGAGAAAEAPALSPHPIFTSDKIESDTHNLKHYAIDNEDDDTDMAESGVIGKYSLAPQVDVRLQLFDMMGNLLAARPLRQQQFLFAHSVEPVAGGSDRPEQRSGSAVVGVKQHEELLLYGVSAAPQAVDGLVLGAAGSVHPSSFSGRLGIAMKPLFSFAGLGYVQSGKPYKKFFCEDGTHHFVILSEYTRLLYVYGRPTKESPTAPQYLLQLTGDDEDEGQQIYGLQTAIVPAPPATTSASGFAALNVSGDAASTAGGPVQGKPLLYVLTRHACRQFQLPIVTLPA